MHQTSELAPKGTETAAQGLMAGMQAGGSLLGIVAGGVIYEYSGGRQLFRCMAVFMAFVLVMYAATTRRQDGVAAAAALSADHGRPNSVLEPLMEAEEEGADADDTE